MANPTNPFNWQMPTSTDLVTDLPADFETFGQAVATSMADLLGGTTGQVLSKASNTDMDFTWVAQDDSNAIQNAIVDAKGDLIAATAADTPARLAVGTNGHVLTADSTAATGMKWAAAAGGGKVLQVVSATYGTEVTTTSSSYVDTGLSLAITPTLSTSKILVLISQHLAAAGTSGDGILAFTALRGATTLWANTYGVLFNMGSTNLGGGNWGYTYLDSPATTSSTTYKTQFRRISASGTQTAQFGSAQSTITLLEIGA